MASVDITFPGNIAQVDTAADLRDLPSYTVNAGALYVVKGLGRAYEFDSGSTALDDGTDVIKPDDRTNLQAGRWVYQMDGFAAGPTGAAANTFTTVAAIKALNPAEFPTAVLAATSGSDTGIGNATFTYQTGNFTGRTDVIVLTSTPISQGAYVRQEAASVSFKTATVSDRLNNELWVYPDIIPKPIWDRIQAGETIDATSYIQPAIDALKARGGGTIMYPTAQFAVRCNLINRQQVSHRGQSRGSSILTPHIDAPVIRTPLDEPCNNWRVENLTIFGNPAFANQDGIRLEAAGAGNFVDTVRLSNLDIRQCGRWGVYARGTATAGPFVQRLHIDNCEIGDNWRNLALLGCVIEVDIIQSSLCETNDPSSTSQSILIDFDSGSIPARINIHGGTIMSNSTKTCIAIGGCETVLIQGCGIEFSNPGIKLVDFALIRNVEIDCNSFQSISPAASQIEVAQCKGLRITNNAFSAGTSITNAINLTGGGAAIPWPVIEGNIATGTGVTNLVGDPSGFLASMTSGAVNVNRPVMSITGSGDLTTLLDERGTLNTLVRGVTKVMILSNGGAITLKHGTGNIFLSGATDYALGAGKSVTFTYVGGGWFESGRS